MFEIDFCFLPLGVSLLNVGLFGNITKARMLSALSTLWEGGVKSLDCLGMVWG